MANVKNRKREHRRCQRRTIFVFEENKKKNIERLFNQLNKDDFWKSIRSYKDGENNKDMTISERGELIKELKELFTMDNDLVINDREKLNIVETVINYETRCKQSITEIEKSYANDLMIRKIKRELKNSNTRGHDGTKSTKNQWEIDDPVMKMTFINEILMNFDLFTIFQKKLQLLKI